MVGRVGTEIEVSAHGGSFTLEASAFGRSGWLDQKEEVLGLESGVVQLLITTAPEDEPGSLPTWPVR
jgi:hypothetical protein